MIKTLIITASLFFAAILLPQTALAQFDPIDQACQGQAAKSDVCQSATEDNPISGTEGIILRVVDILSLVGGIAAVIMIIVGGIKIILSGGDASQVKSGRETLIFAVVGLVIILIARPLIIFIINRT